MIRKLALASVLAAVAAPALAADCAVTIDATDAMSWNVASIEVSKSCAKFDVTLKHVGQLPKNVMGHNWVLTKDTDYTAVAQAGMALGLDKNYVDDADARVIAHTPVIGGGESTTVSVDVSKLSADQAYEYFCSFPGHFAMMKGTLKLVD